MAELIRVDDHRAELSGELLFDTVVPLMKEGRYMMAASKGQWCVDMARVSRVSSVGVALLLDWIRLASESDVEFKIEAMPSHLEPIISISDLDELFAPFLATQAT